MEIGFSSLPGACCSVLLFSDFAELIRKGLYRRPGRPLKPASLGGRKEPTECVLLRKQHICRAWPRGLCVCVGAHFVQLSGLTSCCCGARGEPSASACGLLESCTCMHTAWQVCVAHRVPGDRLELSQAPMDISLPDSSLEVCRLPLAHSSCYELLQRL